MNAAVCHVHHIAIARTSSHNTVSDLKTHVGMVTRRSRREKPERYAHLDPRYTLHPPSLCHPLREGACTSGGVHAQTDPIPIRSGPGPDPDT